MDARGVFVAAVKSVVTRGNFPRHSTCSVHRTVPWMVYCQINGKRQATGFNPYDGAGAVESSGRETSVFRVQAPREVDQPVGDRKFKRMIEVVMEGASRFDDRAGLAGNLGRVLLGPGREPPRCLGRWVGGRESQIRRARTTACSLAGKSSLMGYLGGLLGPCECLQEVSLRRLRGAARADNQASSSRPGCECGSVFDESAKTTVGVRQAAHICMHNRM